MIKSILGRLVLVQNLILPQVIGAQISQHSMGLAELQLSAIKGALGSLVYNALIERQCPFPVTI